MQTVAQTLDETLEKMDPGAQVRAQPYKSTALQVVVTTKIGQSSSHPEPGLGPGLNTQNYYVYNDNRQYHQNHPQSGGQSRPAIMNQTVTVPCQCKLCRSSNVVGSTRTDGKHARIEEYISDEDDGSDDIEVYLSAVSRLSQLFTDGSSGSGNTGTLAKSFLNKTPTFLNFMACTVYCLGTSTIIRDFPKDLFDFYPVD